MRTFIHSVYLLLLYCIAIPPFQVSPAGDIWFIRRYSRPEIEHSYFCVS